MSEMIKIKTEEGHVMYMAPPRPGTCPECAVDHDPAYPHNRDSLFYQYKFFAANNRWPTWADAMMHCDQAMKDMWIEKLREMGVDV